MKFISLIASTLLIVLISQDLTLGLPVNNTTVKSSCPEGSELIEGNCIPVNSTSKISEIQSSTIPAEEPPAHQGKSVTQSVSSEKIAPCPSGMGRGKDGLCREMKPVETMEVTSQLPIKLITDLTTDRANESKTELTTDRAIESTTELDAESTAEVTGVNEASSSGKSLTDCPEGTRRNRQGVCKPLRSSKVTTQSMDKLTTELPTDLTTEWPADLTTELINESKTKSKTEIDVEATTEWPTETTTDMETTSGRGKTLKNCPIGVKQNRQGVCKPWISSDIIEVPTESMDDLTTELVSDLTTEWPADLTTELNTEAETKSTAEKDVELTTEWAKEETADIDTTTSRGKSLKKCPEGMKQNKQGVCKPWRSSKMTKVPTESMDDLTTESVSDLTTEWPADLTTELNTESETKSTAAIDVELTTEWAKEETADVDTTTSRGKSLKKCPEGMKQNKQGVCKPWRSSKMTEVTTESMDDLTTELNTESDIELTTAWPTEEAADVDTTTSRGNKLKSCPEGMKRNKQGVCKPWKSSKMVEDDTQSVDDITTESAKESIAKVNENSSQKDSCPEGTEGDEQGACQKIKSANLNKTVTDLKALLKKDGSCPNNYKMIEGRCLYIKTKIDSKLFPMDSQSNNYASVVIRPKNGDVKSYTVESMPVLSDNSCPEGTEYGEYGLCQKRVDLPKSNRLVTVDDLCQKNYELTNGKCLPRSTKTQVKSKSTTPATYSAESTTIMTKSIDDDEVPESTSTVKSTAEGSDME